jgi:hypothetical protein
MNPPMTSAVPALATGQFDLQCVERLVPGQRNRSGPQSSWDTARNSARQTAYENRNRHG